MRTGCCAWLWNRCQGFVTSALFCATQWRNMNRPRLLSHSSSSHRPMKIASDRDPHGNDPVQVVDHVVPGVVRRGGRCPRDRHCTEPHCRRRLRRRSPVVPARRRSRWCSHFPRSKGRNRIVRTRSIAGLIGSTTLMFVWLCSVHLERWLPFSIDAASARHGARTASIPTDVAGHLYSRFRRKITLLRPVHRSIDG